MFHRDKFIRWVAILGIAACPIIVEAAAKVPRPDLVPEGAAFDGFREHYLKLNGQADGLDTRIEKHQDGGTVAERGSSHATELAQVKQQLEDDINAYMADRDAFNMQLAATAYAEHLNVAGPLMSSTTQPTVGRDLQFIDPSPTTRPLTVKPQPDPVLEELRKHPLPAGAIKGFGTFWIITRDGRKLTGNAANQVALKDIAQLSTGEDGRIYIAFPDGQIVFFDKNMCLIPDAPQAGKSVGDWYQHLMRQLSEPSNMDDTNRNSSNTGPVRG